MVGILVSFWDGLFSGAMLVSGRVPGNKNGRATSELNRTICLNFQSCKGVRDGLVGESESAWWHFFYSRAGGWSSLFFNFQWGCNQKKRPTSEILSLKNRQPNTEAEICFGKGLVSRLGGCITLTLQSQRRLTILFLVKAFHWRWFIGYQGTPSYFQDFSNWSKTVFSNIWRDAV